MFVVNCLRASTKRLALVLAACTAALSFAAGDALAQYSVTSTSWGNSYSNSWSSSYGPNGSYNTSRQDSNWYRNMSQSQGGFSPYGYGSSGFSVNTGGFNSSSQGQGFGPSGSWNYNRGNQGYYGNANVWNRW